MIVFAAAVGEAGGDHVDMLVKCSSINDKYRCGRTGFMAGLELRRLVGVVLGK